MPNLQNTQQNSSNFLEMVVENEKMIKDKFYTKVLKNN